VADIASRLRLVEKKLHWMMDVMRMKVAISSGLSGPDGRPLPGQVIEGTMNEIYALTRTIPEARESDGIDPPPVEENNTSPAPGDIVNG
jgi:hypothetical protein